MSFIVFIPMAGFLVMIVRHRLGKGLTAAPQSPATPDQIVSYRGPPDAPGPSKSPQPPPQQQQQHAHAHAHAHNTGSRTFGEEDGPAAIGQLLSAGGLSNSSVYDPHKSLPTSAVGMSQIELQPVPAIVTARRQTSLDREAAAQAQTQPSVGAGSAATAAPTSIAAASRAPYAAPPLVQPVPLVPASFAVGARGSVATGPGATVTVGGAGQAGAAPAVPSIPSVPPIPTGPAVPAAPMVPAPLF
jgi:hypothetical protein